MVVSRGIMRATCRGKPWTSLGNRAGGEQQEISERLEELETLLEQRKGERRYGA